MLREPATGPPWVDTQVVIKRIPVETSHLSRLWIIHSLGPKSPDIRPVDPLNSDAKFR
jgi:hypothetical protein